MEFGISIANQMNIMETIILPITSSIEFNEGKSPQPSGQSSEFFAKVLDEHQPQIANEKTGPTEEKDDNPDSSSATDLSPSMLGEIPSLLISPARLQFAGGILLNHFNPANPNGFGSNSSDSSFFPLNLPKAQNTGASNILPLAVGISQEENTAIPPLPGKSVPIESGIMPPTQKLPFPSQAESLMEPITNQYANEKWDIKNLFSEDIKGKDGVFSLKNESPDISGKGSFHSPVSLGGFQDLGGSQKISIEQSGDLKMRMAASLNESGDTEVSQQVGRKMIWSLDNNVEKIKVALDPPQLGNIYIEICKEKENIKATIWADNLTAKVALEASQVQIQKIMENQGLKLDQFNVFLQENLGWFQESRENFLDANPHNSSPSREKEPEGPTSLDILPVWVPGQNPRSHYLDILI